jgi:hypothetical protein
MATLPAILGVCIPAGRVPHFIEAFNAAQEHRKQVRGAKAAAERQRVQHAAAGTQPPQEEERVIPEEEERAVAEKARIDSMASDLPLLRTPRDRSDSGASTTLPPSSSTTSSTTASTVCS